MLSSSEVSPPASYLSPWGLSPSSPPPSPSPSPPPSAPPLTLKPLNLATSTLLSLTALLTSLSVPKYRAKQIHDYIRVRGITDLTQMSQLPKSLVATLLPLTSPSSLRVSVSQTSAKDGTVKRGYLLPDDQIIESVLMPYRERTTACISSQAGCAMGW